MGKGDWVRVWSPRGSLKAKAVAWLLVGSARHSTLVRPFYAKVEAGLTPEQRRDANALTKRRVSDPKEGEGK